MSSIQVKDKEYVANTYARFPVEIVSGKGSVVVDSDGKSYIDMGSGIGVTSFGISDNDWANAVTEQLNKVQHTSNLYYTTPCTELAELMCNKTGMKKVFFSNSGAEANECAIKTARKYAADKKGDEYFTVITLINSFHGRTITTLSATGQEHYHQHFKPLTSGFVHTPANDFDALKKLTEQHKTAAVILECVQGEGGVIPLDEDFVKKTADLCKEQDIILIIDEVQTGNGRTGSLYAYMNYSIAPDIVTTAKGLGGGLPIGATLFNEKTRSVLGYGDHGSTFGGNPAVCAGALSIIKRIDDKLLSKVTEKSEYIFSELKNADGIKSVSGMGLMVGIETVKPATDVVAECIKKGVLCLTAKTKVRLLPALNIEWEVLKQAISIIKSVCAEN